jgi:hypothetical protein
VALGCDRRPCRCFAGLTVCRGAYQEPADTAAPALRVRTDPARRSMRKLVLLLALALLGCGTDPGRTADPVDFSGEVTLNGKPLSAATLHLQPTGAGTEAFLPVKSGTFRGKVTPGRYTYYVSGAKGIPEKFRAGSLDRQTDIAAGTTLRVTLE